MKRFKTKNTENSSTKQIETCEMLNITPENSTDAMKKSNIVNRDVRINNKVQDEAVRNTVKNLNEDDQIFKNITADDNLLSSETRDISAINKPDSRCLNRLTEIESSLNRIGRRKNTAAFAAINKISIEKE